MKQSNQSSHDTSICGVILAGGASRRMEGKDKGLLKLGNESILSQVINRARPQVSKLLLNINGSTKPYRQFHLPLIKDKVSEFRGPLAGIHSAMDWLQTNQPQCEWVASFACDTPFISYSLIARLHTALEDNELAVVSARQNNRLQPIFSLWSIKLLAQLYDTISQPVIPSLESWISSQKHKIVDFDLEPEQCFLNINTPQDYLRAQQIYKQVTL